MIIQKKTSNKNRAVKASRRTANRRARSIRANEEMEVEDVDAEVSVEADAASLLFEAEDVAELVAEVTGEDVNVTTGDDVVVFEIGDDEFTVEADGDEEILESSRKAFRGKTAVKASRRVARPRRRR
jgi:hypothetical protein